jgi:hypothetical protein
MPKIITTDFNAAGRALRKPVGSTRCIGCAPNLIQSVKADLVARWKRGINIKSLAAIFQLTHFEAEAVIREQLVTNVIPFPGPGGSGPSPSAPGAVKATERKAA